MSLIKNVGTEPVEVFTGSVEHPHINEYGEPGDTWDTERFYETLEPGQTMELAAPQAVGALQRNCRHARPTKFWRKWGGTQDVLKEVGYVCRIGGKTIDSREHKPSKERTT